ncbi:hypothetical protein [Acaryochloris sp. CCMEE 5410]|uniref:hypothetical protein n=1 Tax=Acaryochloris sp. CCMEE 5410 TaxID=310037 RepID=UPI0021CE23B9|nr:hypothetical protein [Acaryochloris sp. CCMEE 5410]KAI9129126.1 hypothetical protein ON05_036345 [Acaryochloris sp. CCMEE 5410]
MHIRQPGDPYRGDVGANFYFQESQDPAIAAATLGVLGVESTAVDPNSIYASASGQSIPASPVRLRVLVLILELSLQEMVSPQDN